MANDRPAPRSIRFPAKQEALITADCQRLGITFNAWVTRAAAAMLAHGKPDSGKGVRMRVESQCRHPINRRIGTGCGSCGKENVK